MEYDENYETDKSYQTPSKRYHSKSKSRSKSKVNDNKKYNIDDIYSSISNKRDYEPRSEDPIPILTPRSDLACRRCGVLPNDLRIRDLDSFWQSNIDPAIQHMRHEAYSQMRHDLMALVRKERDNVISELGEKPKAKKENVKRELEELKQKQEATLLNEERERLAKIKLQQQKEIAQLLDYEVNMAKINEENQKKLEQEAELKERRKQEEIARKKQKAEEERQKQLRKKMEEDEDERQKREYAKKEY